MQQIRACLVAVVIIAALLATTTVAISAEEAATKSATPEDAVSAYLDGIAEADFDKILEVVAVDEPAEGFRFEEFVERLKAFVPSTPMAPSDYDFYVQVNRAERTAGIARQARWLAYSLLTDVEPYVTTVVDRAWAESFIEEADPSRLDAMVVVDIRTPEPDLMDETRTQVNLARLARIYRADEWTERVALVSIGNDLYLVGFQLARYGDDWKVFSQFSPSSGTDSSGVVYQTSAAEFDELTSRG